MQFMLLNDRRLEIVTYYNLEDNSIWSDEVEEVEKLEKEKKVIVFPYRDELISYGEIVQQFLEIEEVEVPKGERVKAFFRRTNRDGRFEDYEERILDEKFNDWLRNKGLEKLIG